jgi:hypothetical protein
MAHLTYRQIDWSSAEVCDGALSVQLTGAAAKRWGEHFDGVLALLAQGNGKWGEVTLTKRAVTVDGISEGLEEELRHLLESVVLQVNTELGLEPEADDGQPAEDPQKAVDRRLTESFRAFATAGRLMQIR